jgi:hypothetical protein
MSSPALSIHMKRNKCVFGFFFFFCKYFMKSVFIFIFYFLKKSLVVCFQRCVNSETISKNSFK